MRGPAPVRIDCAMMHSVAVAGEAAVAGDGFTPRMHGPHSLQLRLPTLSFTVDAHDSLIRKRNPPLSYTPMLRYIR
jgi:hypothetical protein